MSTCSHCLNSGVAPKKKPGFFLKLVGFHEQCEKCGNLYFQLWRPRPLAFLILSILLFQFLTSLFLFPLLDWIIVSDQIHLIVFTFCHILLLPMYWLVAVSLTLNSVR